MCIKVVDFGHLADIIQRRKLKKKNREYFNDDLVRADDTYNCSLKCSLMTNEKFFLFVVSI